MKLYVYISDVKIDRILAALTPPERERLAEELHVPLALLALAQTPPRAADETRFARATAASRQLELAGAIAPFPAEAPYVRGELPLHWGRLRHVQGADLLRHDSESPAWFAQLARDRSSELIMAGSARLLLAQPPAARVDHAQLELPPGAARFDCRPCASEYDSIDRRCLELAFEPTPAPEGGAYAQPSLYAASTAVESEAWMDRLELARQQLAVLPEQRLQFLAKPLVRFEGGLLGTGPVDARAKLLLACPLWVAIAI